MHRLGGPHEQKKTFGEKKSRRSVCAGKQKWRICRVPIETAMMEDTEWIVNQRLEYPDRITQFAYKG
jgi:hypothetical protein